MKIDQKQYEILSDKAVKVLGRQTVLQMSDAQQGLLNKALDRMLERAGTVDKITDAQIEGQYEQIVMHVLPTGSHEHFLK